MAPHILLAMLCLAVAEEPRQRLAPRRRAASADDHCLEICAFASGGATCLEALPFQDEGCPSDAHIVDMPDCSGPLGLGDLCEADGECKTNKRIDNCEYVGLQVADIYRVVTKPSPAPSAVPAAAPADSPDPTTRAAAADDHCLEICAFASGGATCLEALPFQDEGCPSDARIVDMPDCSGPLGLGELCEADGECKTNKRIDNCEYAGLQAADIYRVVTKPSAAPSPAPSAVPAAAPADSPDPTKCPSVVPTVRKRRASRRSLLFFVLLVMFVASVAGLVLCYLCLFCVGCFVAGGSRGKRGTDDVTGAFRDDVAAAQELPAVGAYEAPVASPLGEDRERSLERVAFATPILYEEL